MSDTDTRVVDADLLGRLLLAVEANAHRDGWDAPAGLYVLYDWHEQETERHYRDLMAERRGGPVRCGRYAAQSVSAKVLDGIASHAVFRLALNLTYACDHSAVETFVETLRTPGFLGVALRCESWMRRCADDAERAALGKARFADIPGSLETRGVYAADVAGGFRVVHRVRGEKPELLTASDDFKRSDGAIPQALAVITAGIAGLPKPELTIVPAGWAYPDA